MSKTMWTNEQLLAITEEGTNILVSAGAGSGKTAVLTERIMRKLKSGVKLNQLVVLTFTKAAASEMKERLRKKLLDEVKNGNDSLKEELDYIDQANIQTFDSFSLYLVKKYHYILGVERNIQIGDGSIFVLQRKRAIDEVFNELYDEGDKSFIELVKRYCLKNDEALKENINTISQKLDLLVEKETYLNTFFESYYSDEVINCNIEKFTEILINYKEKIKQLIEVLKESINDEKLVDTLLKIEKEVGHLIQANTYDEFKNSFPIKLPQLPRVGKKDDENESYLEEKEVFSKYKDEISKTVKDIEKKCCYKDINEMKEEVFLFKDTAKVIANIIKKVDQKLLDFKKQKNIYEFIDISKMAIQLMKENNDICDSYKKSLNEILVDEYQDTSDIQETLISLISNNNVYMVGDIKQSIYRFRNANPDLFKDKFSNFYNERGGKLIQLSKNFRSREEVLDNINLIFSKVMGEKIGGANYNYGHELIFGNTTYSSFKNENNNMDIITYECEENVRFTKKEIEATLIAKDIKNKIKNGYLVYDRKVNGLRKATFNDFAILTSDKSSYNLYKKVFDYYEIPLVTHVDEAFIESEEIVVVKNLLKCIYSYNDCEYYKDNFRYSFLSLIRSFLVEASDEQIFEYYNQDNKEQFVDIITNLKEIAKFSKENTLGETLEKVYEKFNIYEKINLLKNIDSIENRLHYLLEKAYSLSSLGYSIGDFLEYLDFISNNDKLDIEFIQNKSFESEACNILTIHKSKGLEFNICYFPQLTTSFNQKDLKDRILFDNRYGVIAPYFLEGLKEPFYKDVLAFESNLDEISEKIRLFYVALTRAKDKIILICPIIENDFGCDEVVSDYDKTKYRSFYDITLSIGNYLNSYIKKILINKDFVQYKNEKSLKKDREKNVIVFEKTFDVSLKGSKIESRKASISKNSLINKEERNKLNFGTNVHSYFEFVEKLEDIYELKLENKFILEVLEKFYSTDLLKSNIINKYHEYEFVYEENGTLIRGIIDLLLETKDKFIIIDYKLKDIEKEGYSKQMNIYKNYIELISNKKVEAYLYSIIDGEFKKID